MVINEWDDTQLVPAGYHVSTKPRTNLVVGGAVTFASLYAITAGTCAFIVAYGGSAAVFGFIPIAGPFTLIPTTSGNAATDFFLVLDGLGQAAGAALFIAGFMAPKKMLVRNDVVSSGLTLMPRPMTFGRNGAGLGLTGAF
jgi:hypothetical protein